MFDQNFIAPTPPAADNSNQIATTAFVQAALAASNLTVGTSVITGGTSGDILYDNAGVLGNATLSTLLDSAFGTTAGAIIFRGTSLWIESGAPFLTTTEPSTGQDLAHGFNLGSVIINKSPSTTQGAIFVCLDNTSSAAVWDGLCVYDANNNVLAGRATGLSLSGGTLNVFVGYRAGLICTSATCTGNVIVGANAFDGATTANQNTCIGYQTGANISTDVGHTLVGYQAGFNLNGGGNNWCTLVGHVCGFHMTTAGSSVAMGRGAAFTTTNDVQLCAIGHGAYFYGTGGLDVTCLGDNSGGSILDGTGPNYGPASSHQYGSTADTHCLFVGGTTGKASAAARTNCTGVGYLATVPIADNVMVLGNQLNATNTSGTLWSGGYGSQAGYATDSQQTFLAADLAGGIIRRTGMTADRQDKPDTAANIVKATHGPGSGNESNIGITVYIINTTASSDTLQTNTGVTYTGSSVIAANTTGMFRMVCTNCMSGTEAVLFVRLNA